MRQDSLAGYALRKGRQIAKNGGFQRSKNCKIKSQTSAIGTTYGIKVLATTSFLIDDRPRLHIYQSILKV